MSNQVLLYSALVLASIGAYGTLTSGDSDLEGLISEASGESTDITSLLTALSKKVSDLESRESKQSGGGTGGTDELGLRLSKVETWMKNRVDETKNVASDPNATTEQVAESVIQRLSDVESEADLNSQDIITLVGDVNTNTQDISTMLSDFQEQISFNDSDISAMKTAADDVNTAITGEFGINTRLTDLETGVSDLQGIDTNMEERLSGIESDRILEATERSTMSGDIVANGEAITTNLNSIQDIEQDLTDVYQAAIDSNASNIVSLNDDASYLWEKLRRVTGDAGEDEVVCYSKFKTEGGADISLDDSELRLGASNDDNWMIYRAGNGTDRAKGYGITGNSTRVRIGKASNQGFIVENANKIPLFSVRSHDALTKVFGNLQVDNNVRIWETEKSAHFGHVDVSGGANNMHQTKDGTLVLGTPTYVTTKVNRVEMLQVNKDKTVIHKEILLKGQNSTSDTHFNYQNAGSNWISAKDGGATNFRFGQVGPTVAIKNKEININGTNVLEKLNSLQKQINDLETTLSSSYVKTGDTYYMKGHKDSWSAELGYSGDDARWNKSNTRMIFKMYKN